MVRKSDAALAGSLGPQHIQNLPLKRSFLSQLISTTYILQAEIASIIIEMPLSVVLTG
jgi:hypothetical protein